MLTTRQKSLRHFWYATVRADKLSEGIVPFRLMGEDLVLFRDKDGAVAALEDRCCHRTAKLTRGWCEAGEVVCGYHGWRFGGDGKVTAIPQLEAGKPLPDHRVKAYRAVERYGYVWVALDEPEADICAIPEDGAPGWRRIFQFDEPWNTAPLRLMENSFDNSHFAFVHRGTFGDITQPMPRRYELTETDFGFRAEAEVEVLNPPNGHRITGCDTPTTIRILKNEWYLPFCRRLDMGYPSGVRHIIINCATPIDDGRIQVIQLLYRNDTEADCPAEMLIEWDRAIIVEDRDILESTSPDAPLDISRRVEAHMHTDRPGLIMRRRLLDHLRDHGEDEVTEQYR